MPDFIESIAKKIIRESIFDNSKELRKDKRFSYLGLPGRDCKDLNEWKDSVRIAHCCEKDDEKFDDMNRNLIRLFASKGKAYKKDIWEFLNDSNRYEEFIDLLNLDFFGGPIISDDPHLIELRALNSFLSAQMNKDKNQSFIIAWTLGVRNTSIEYYIEQNLSYATGVFSNINTSELQKWLSDEKKMLKNYYLYIPSIMFDYAQRLRYKISVIETYVYKKTMYYSLLKLTPQENIITDMERSEFIKDIFKSSIYMYDLNLEYIEALQIPKFILSED